MRVKYTTRANGWKSRLMIFTASFVLSLVSLASATFAQETQTTDNKADSNLKSMARVNPSTLAMELSVPLAEYPGRAGNSTPVVFDYSSKVWKTKMYRFRSYSTGATDPYYDSILHETTDVRAYFSQRQVSGWTSSLRPLQLMRPRETFDGSGNFSRRFGIGLLESMPAPEDIPNTLCYNVWSPIFAVPASQCSSGLAFTSQEQCFQSNFPSEPWWTGPSTFYCLNGPEPPDPHQPLPIPLEQPKKVYRMRVQMSDGTTHEFRKDDKVYDCAYTPQECVSHPEGTYLAVDGSSMKIVTNQVIDGVTSDVLYLPDGGKYIFPRQNPGNPVYNGVQKFVDRNGNTSSYDFATGTWTDTLGRSIQDPFAGYSSSPNSTGEHSFNLKGKDNTDRTHFLTWSSLGGVLEDTNTMALKHTGAENCINMDESPVSGGVLFPNPTADPNDDEILPNRIRRIRRERTCDDGVFNPVVLSKITLPNGKFYEFKYNEYGEITKIKYPGGAFERFEYQQVAPMGANVKDVYAQGNRGVHKRYVSFDGTNIAQTWTYDVDDTAGYKVKTTAPDNSLSERDLWVSGDSAYGFEDPRAGKVLEEKVFDNADHVHPRSRTLTKWETKGPQGEGAFSGAERDARVKETATIIFEPASNSALATMTKFEYDDSGSADPSYFSHLNLKRKKTYHYAVIQNKTTVDNEVLDWNTIEGWFTNVPLASDVQTNYSYNADFWARGIIGLPWETIVWDPANSNVILSQSQSYYDDGTNYPLINAGTSSAWQDPSSGLRGNVTTSKTLLKDPVTNTSSWIETHTQYDNFGNPRKAWDAAGNMTETQYSSDYGYAYPTKVIAPAPDPNNSGHGTDQTSSVETTYDLTTGLVLSVKNDYGQIIKTEYNDPLLRPTRTYAYNFTAPESQIIYDDDAHTVKLRKQIDETNWDEATTFMDVSGRTIRTEAKDSQGDVIVNTHYDLMGRVDCITNPYRSGEAAYWNKIRFDESGRAVETYAPIAVSLCQTAGQTLQSLGTTSFDISTVANYQGTVVISTDASQRKGRSITNALGQLVRVDEPTAFGGTVTADLGAIDAPLQPTYYTYSKLGQMVKVQQGKAGETIQYRHFLYDNLGRLLRIKQPEQEANTGLPAYTDPITGNSSWSAAFTYDVQGNTLTATDAKGTITANDYDNAGRVKTRSYSNEPSGITTPTVNYFYDGKGLSGTVNFAKGKLTKVSSSVSETRYTNFDHMGRALSSEQITDGQTYPMSYKYNLPGALVEETYPSGEVVRSFLETDGDLSRVAVSGYTYVSNFTYTAKGEISALKLGNGTWETAQFNTRRQVTQLGLGTASNNTSLWKVNYEYGELQSNDVVDVVKNTGNIARQTLTIPNTSFVQSYKYDSLKRLTEAKETTGSQNWIQTFGYDRFGNRTGFNQQMGSLTLNTTPAVDANTNRFSTGFVYDKNGNIIQDGQSTSTRSFSFNGDNKQIQVRNSVGTPIGTYLYDGDGKRVKKVTNSETTVFVYDGLGKLVAEYSNQVSSTPTISYTTTDHLGSPRVITDKNGNVTSRRDFMPFGEELNAGTPNRTEAAKYAPASDGLRKKFTGYEKDAETGLDFAAARYYNNQYGRFTAVDPLLASGRSANPQTFNRFVYVGNNPMLRIDPTGQDWWEHTELTLNGYSGTSSYVTFYEWRDEPGNNFSGSYVYQITHGPGRGNWMALNPYENQYREVKTQAQAQRAFKNFLGERNINASRGFTDALASFANAGTNPIVGSIYATLYEWGADATIGRPDPNSNVYVVTNRVTNASIIITLTVAGPALEVFTGSAEIVTIAREAEVISTSGEVSTASTLEPGQFAGRSIPARGPGPVNASEQSAINEIGGQTGCHTCGTTNPGTKSGNFVADHQPPSSLATPERLYPHCIRCSNSQGGVVRGVQSGRIPNPFPPSQQ